MNRYATRRKKVMEKVGEGVLILASAPPFECPGGLDYRYRQDSDFFYLTGFEESDSVCVLAPSHPEHKFVMFVKPKDPKQEVWTGKLTGVEDASKQYGADIAYSIEELEKYLPNYLDCGSPLYYSLGRDEHMDKMVISKLSQLRRRLNPKKVPSSIVEPSVILAEMRLFKGQEEIAEMREAASLTEMAFKDAMAMTKPGIYEYEIEAMFLGTFRRGGGITGYPPVIASGENATILHYGNNDRMITDTDLVLVDSGVSLNYYTADVTRTWPASGRFTDTQREVYQAVLKAQEEAIKEIRPGKFFGDFHDRAVRVLTEWMVEKGLLKGRIDRLIKKREHEKFYMHRTGHWVGIDPEDCGQYFVDGKLRELKPGMIIAVEPGIYIPISTEGCDKKYCGIGIRIEDDVLVTENGNEVLTKNIPKSIDEIERQVSEAKICFNGSINAKCLDV